MITNDHFGKIKLALYTNISIIIKHLGSIIAAQNQKKPFILNPKTGSILLFIIVISCGKIFPQTLIYENNDKIWENFIIFSPFLIKFSHL